MKIGVLVPYTESSIGVDIGLNQKRAADLYLKIQGGKLGGRAASLVYSAESVDANINKVKARTLTETEKVAVLMGAASSETATVLRDAAEASKMVFIDTNATANDLTRSRKSSYLFRTSASSWQLNVPLGEWAARHGKTEFFVAYVDDSFGKESADAFTAGLQKGGGGVTERLAFANGSDWTKAISAVKAQATRNVYAAFQTDDAEGFIAEWDKQGLSSTGYKLFGPGGLTEEPVLVQAKAAAEGIVTGYFWSSELDSAENMVLAKQFPREYSDDETGVPVDLSGYAVEMWDAMAALDTALKQTSGNTSDVNALIAAIEGVSLKSPRGSFVFDKATHNPVQDILIRQVKMSNGKPVNAVLESIPQVADPGA
ncbi:MAG: ABC transporter substrate-binding protein [Chloroflexota bacterium]